MNRRGKAAKAVTASTLGEPGRDGMKTPGEAANNPPGAAGC